MQIDKTTEVKQWKENISKYQNIRKHKIKKKTMGKKTRCNFEIENV